VIKPATVAKPPTVTKPVTVAKAVTKPATSGFPVTSDLDAATRYAFDLAADLMSVQRRFALQLANVLSGKTD